jgi:type I restriction enzyme, S subunit
MASDLIGGRVDTEHCSFISEEQARSLRKGFAYAGDVLISHKATMGRTAIVDELDVPFLMLTPQVTYYRVIDTARLCPRYLRYYFDSPTFQVLFNTWGQKGSTRAYVGITAQLDLPIVLPPPSEQYAIGYILGALDDKIELNRRMNETLEEMARTLFKSWFVDFHPLRAKSAGRHAGMLKSLADIFPDDFEASSRGQIPKGWKVGKISDLVDLLRDQLNPLEKPDQTFSHYSIPAFDNGQHPKDEKGEDIKSLKFVVPPGTLLLSKLNPEIERTWLVDVQPNEQAVCSTEFLVFRPKYPFSREYLYCLLRSPAFRQDIESLVTGTSKSHQRAQTSTILGLDVVLPCPTVVTAFNRTIGALLERVTISRRESLTLTALRDTLLPNLISGELPVKDAEALVARSA